MKVTADTLRVSLGLLLVFRVLAVVSFISMYNKTHPDSGGDQQFLDTVEQIHQDVTEAQDLKFLNINVTYGEADVSKLQNETVSLETKYQNDLALLQQQKPEYDQYQTLQMDMMDNLTQLIATLNKVKQDSSGHTLQQLNQRDLDVATASTMADAVQDTYQFVQMAKEKRLADSWNN